MTREVRSIEKGTEEFRIFTSLHCLKAWQKYRMRRNKLRVIDVIKEFQKGKFPLIQDLYTVSEKARFHFFLPNSSYKQREIRDIIWSYLVFNKYAKDFFDVD